MLSDNSYVLYSMVLGVIITASYDGFRIVRRVVPHNELWISLEDLFYWAVVCVNVFYIMNTQSNGTLRWFTILGALVGMFLYKKTVSTVLVKYISLVLNWVKGLACRLLAILGRPLKKMELKASAVSHRASGSAKKKLTQLKKMIKMVLCKR